MKLVKRILLALAGILVLIFLSLILYVRLNTPDIKLSKTIPEIDKEREPRALTSFFGLDNSTPLISLLVSWKAPGKDGMPIVFSHEINPETLDEADFEVSTAQGDKFLPDIVTLLPANEEFELRTVLMIGQFGDHPNNQPVSTKIIGDLMSRTGHNFKGQTVQVTPLPEGPFFSYAEYFTFDEDYPYVKEGRGCDCPRDETAMVVRAIWAGGVRAVDGGELGENELRDLSVTLVQNKDTLIVHPFQLADLDDNDNYTDLCLSELGIPILVKANENIAIDPRGDKNPRTSIEVLSRW